MISALVCLVLAAAPVVHPVFPPKYGADDVEKLKSYVSAAMAMSPQELADLVPVASGIHFIGCPNCHGGAQENGVFEYSLDLGDRVKCRFCGMVFPNDQFPNNRERVIIGPNTGVRQVYRWYEDAEGHQHFFEAHAWWHRWRWTQDQAQYLANLYALTGDSAYGDRAAAIIGRYAQVFPDYPIRFDYPYRPVKFFPADQKFPYDGVESYRGAKFYWWAYADIPEMLARAYDLIAPGDSLERVKNVVGDDARVRIENDLLRLAYEFTAANPDSYSNMSPGMYHDMIVVGRIIGEPAMVHEAIKRFRALMEQKFFFDGWWCEGAPSYHDQTVNNLLSVAQVAQGYSDPPDWPEALHDLDLSREVPLLAKAATVGFDGVLPDGRLIPINDTWSTQKKKPLTESVPRLWAGLGHAVLGAGTGANQFQVHLNWSGAFGHSHADNASIILFAHGKELLSDLGYTHTRYRNWMLNTASHNTVVIDSRSQVFGSKAAPTTGSVLAFDAADPRVRYVDVDATSSYPAAELYRRRVVHVHLDEGRDIVLDVFDVKGGQTHDYFLHGSADDEGTLTTSTATDTPVDSLVPDWGGRGTYESELNLDLVGTRLHAYDFLRDITAGTANGPWIATWQYGDTGLRAHLFPEEGTTIYRFVAPSVRQARNDDSLVDRYLRHGIMQRHDGGTSRFVAVHEPFTGEPWLDEVTWDNGTLHVSYGQATVTLRVDGERVTAESSEGWRYDSGTPHSGNIVAVERGDANAIVADRPLPSVSSVRVTFAGGRSVVYSVVKTEGARLYLPDDPGFDYDAGAQVAQFAYFPQERFSGQPRYTVYVGSE